MAWTAPMTAVAGSVFTAAQFNANIRDNFAETVPAKATTPGSYFTTSATNQITERVAATASVNSSESTTSTTFTDLTTLGPSVTVTTGVQALVIFSAEITNNTVSQAGRVAVDISGASAIGPDSQKVLRQESSGTAEFQRASVGYLQTGLTPGANTFKMVYSTVGTSTSAFNQRNITVLPL
jgi:hypothetical protein